MQFDDVFVPIPFRQLHIIREKLQTIVLAANGPNALTITSAALDIARILPQEKFQPQSVG